MLLEKLIALIEGLSREGFSIRFLISEQATDSYTQTATLTYKIEGKGVQPHGRGISTTHVPLLNEGVLEVLFDSAVKTIEVMAKEKTPA